MLQNIARFSKHYKNIQSYMFKCTVKSAVQSATVWEGRTSDNFTRSCSSWSRGLESKRKDSVFSTATIGML